MFGVEEKGLKRVAKERDAHLWNGAVLPTRQVLILPGFIKDQLHYCMLRLWELFGGFVITFRFPLHEPFQFVLVDSCCIVKMNRGMSLSHTLT